MSILNKGDRKTKRDPNTGLEYVTSRADLDSHIYYNIVVINNTAQPRAARFSETAQKSILNNPSEYHMSCIRFEVPMAEEPLIVFEENKLSVTLSMVALGVNQIAQTFLVYEDQYTNEQKLFDPNAEDNIYTYSTFISMINTALDTAFAELIGRPGVAAALPVGLLYAPFFVYYPTTQLIGLYAQEQYYNNPEPAPTISIYINTALSQYLRGFELLDNGTQDSVWNSFGRNFLFLVYDKGNNRIQTIPPYVGVAPAAGPFIIMETDYSNLYSWNNTRSIAFLSGSIPIATELSPAFDPDGNATVNTNYKRIVTDFIPQITDASSALTYTLYVPTAEYRLIDLKGTDPLRTIDIDVYIVDKLQNYRLLYIPPGDSMTIKLMFRKKVVITSND